MNEYIVFFIQLNIEIKISFGIWLMNHLQNLIDIPDHEVNDLLHKLMLLDFVLSIEELYMNLIISLSYQNLLSLNLIPNHYLYDIND